MKLNNLVERSEEGWNFRHMIVRQCESKKEDVLGFIFFQSENPPIERSLGSL